MNGITSLEEYFSWLKTLGNIQAFEDRDFGKKYTILPLDEPHFEINANTRAIQIPNEFKKNGIAVQTDDLAEIVYFEVDRYFDYMDLNNCDIYIQWEIPKSGEKNVSVPYVRDIESKPGKLIFGWAISDALTGTAGTLKFSVRFFQWKDDEQTKNGGQRELAYSFSTLVAQVNIQASIGIDLENDDYKVDDVGDRLTQRLKDSEVIGGVAASMPEWVVKLVEGDYDLDPENGTYEMVVQARSADTGAISYSWSRQALDEDNSTENQPIDTNLPATNHFELVEDPSTMNKAYIYYFLNGSTYSEWTGNVPPDAEEVERYQFYIKQSQCIADKVGVYWATATNRITNSSTSTPSNEVVKIRFPRPEDVIVSEYPKNSVLIPDEELNLACILSAEGGNTDGELTYKWQFDPNKAFNFGEAVPSFTDIEDANGMTYEAKEAGHYRVIITNTRNKETKDTLNVKKHPEYGELIARVTEHAQAPKIEEITPANKVFKISSLTEVNCPTINLDSTIESDYYEVVWYLDSADESVDDIQVTDVITLSQGTYISKFNPKDFEEKLAEMGEDLEGSYYPIVTNYVNGSFIKTEIPEFADMFTITD